MRKLLGVLLFGLVAASSSLAFAQASKPALPSEDCARLRKKNPKGVCELTIESIDVTGSTPAGGHETIVARKDPGWGTLIRPRGDFRDKIIASADDLR